MRVNAQMHNLDLAKNGARPQNVMGNYRKTEKGMKNKTVYIVLFALFFNSCEYFPYPETKALNYNYSGNNNEIERI